MELVSWRDLGGWDDSRRKEGRNDTFSYACPAGEEEVVSTLDKKCLPPRACKQARSQICQSQHHAQPYMAAIFGLDELHRNFTLAPLVPRYLFLLINIAQCGVPVSVPESSVRLMLGQNIGPPIGPWPARFSAMPPIRDPQSFTRHLLQRGDICSSRKRGMYMYWCYCCCCCC
jgi:hypothetical protein